MITVTWSTGINSSTSPPGYQLNLALAGLALVVTIFGSGRFSLDALIERRLSTPQPSVEAAHLAARSAKPSPV